MESLRYPLFVHGWYMVCCWFGLAWIMIATKRYLNHIYFWSTMIHSVIGTIIFILTIYVTIEQLVLLMFRLWHVTLHTVTAFLCVALIIVVWLCGFFGLVLSKQKVTYGYKELHTKLLKVHVYLGWANFFVSFIANVTGIYYY